MTDSANRFVSIRRFQKARRSSKWEQITARLTGRDTHLLPFEEIRRQLRQQSPRYQGVSNVPLDAIVGSVGRYKEFTRRFLPLNDSLEARWVAVDGLTTSTGWPPVDLYKVGDIYFVKDGNHRVSVARQLKLDAIEALVWEFPVTVGVSPEAKLDDIFIQLGEETFLEKTRLDSLFPKHNIRFTSPGGHSELLAQIESLRQTLSVIDEEEMAYPEAVAAWYEMVYLPIVQIIQQSTLLEGFPGRTEADLFVWLSQHQEQLEVFYGDSPNLLELVRRLAEIYREGNINKLIRQMRRALGDKTPPPLPMIDNSFKEN